MTNSTPVRRRLTTMVLAMAVVGLAGATACTDFLVAENPGAVEEPDVNDPAYVNLIAGGPIYAFQGAVTDQAYWNAQLTDELFNRAVFAEEGQIDRRELFSDMSYIGAFIYSPMQRARFLGEDASRRLKTILGDSATRDLRVARSLAYGGYAYVMLAETMCETPIDLSAPKPPEELFTTAIAQFEEAIDIATAAKAHLQSLPNPNANAIAATDSVRHFALVGAARAALNKNDKTAAAAFATQVPAGFEFRAYYSDNTTVQRSRTFERLTLGSNATLANTPFEAKTGDPRIPRIGGTTARANIPLSPSSYSSFNNTVAGAPFTPVMSVRIASHLEAQYIIAEAQGPTPATLAFVNSRRAAGLQTPVSLTGDALMEELREQRSRDFYLDGHRLGDLRRYLKYYQVDLFPKGPYPTSTAGLVYDDATCWPLPRTELNSNPNIP